MPFHPVPTWARLRGSRHVRALGQGFQVDVSYLRLAVRAIPFGINLWLVKRDDIHLQNTARSSELAGVSGDGSSGLRRPRPGPEIWIAPHLNSATDGKVTCHVVNRSRPDCG